MQNSHFSTFTDKLARAEQAVRKLAGEFKQWLPGATWLEILLVCIPLALAVTLLPIVITLFVIGIILQWLLSPRAATQPQTDTPTQENEPRQEIL
jgi:hypothetical protein